MRQPVRYDVDLTDRRQHLVRVTLSLPDDLAAGARVVLSAWTPGSYVIRDYVHHVQWIHALDDRGPISLIPDGTSAWRLADDVASGARVDLELYANDLSVRTNHVDDQHALLIPAATFPWVEGARDRPHEVHLVATPSHHRVFSLLPEADAADTWIADDLDHLIDSAFEVGDHQQAAWEVAGVAHQFVWAGPGRIHGLDDLATDAEAISREAVTLFDGALPARHHTTLCVAWDRGGGGLEHRDGAVLQVPVHTFGDPAMRARLQVLYAHEYLHLFNARRLVPAALVSPDLERPVQTESLWVAEGWTSYYDELLPTRAGAWTAAQWLDHLGSALDQVWTTPGVELQSLRQASRDAWVKHYVRDENSPNAGTDYYNHGALVAWELDLRIRGADPDSDGLDVVLRQLWDRHAGAVEGYTEDDVLAAIGDVAGDALRELARTRVDTPGWPDIDDELLAPFGLRLEPASPSTPAAPDLGVVVTEDDRGVTFASVLRDGSAWRAGITGGDRLVAIDAITVGRGELSAALAARDAGDVVEIAVVRGPRLLTLPVELDAPRRRHRLATVDTPDAAQRQAFRRWTGQDLPTNR
ncbi:MAG: PDZ domain-containing protein [Nitriliruptoraceae bacterium]